MIARSHHAPRMVRRESNTPALQIAVLAVPSERYRSPNAAVDFGCRLPQLVALYFSMLSVVSEILLQLFVSTFDLIPLARRATQHRLKGV